MRYRPFARTGMAVSTLSLSLDGGDDAKKPSDWRELIHAAFEEGVNAFEIVHPTLALLTGFAEGASVVKRSLIFAALRVDAGVDSESLEPWVRQVISRAGIGVLNLVTTDAGASRADGMLLALQQLRTSEAAHHLAVAGAGDLLAEDIDSGHFDAIVTPFNMLSTWRDRNQVRKALEQQMGVIACDPFPPALASLLEATEVETKPPGWFKKAKPLAGMGTYAFLSATRGWTAEQLCLAYALTEPAVASVQMPLESRERLKALAGTSDRDLPSTVSAQIEMARFSEKGGLADQPVEGRRTA
jgi:aryl-alcohol dehydrogenase-like predicted oxidoreductase